MIHESRAREGRIGKPRGGPNPKRIPILEEVPPSPRGTSQPPRGFPPYPRGHTLPLEDEWGTGVEERVGGARGCGEVAGRVERRGKGWIWITRGGRRCS